MARHSLNIALSATALMVASGCTHFDVNAAQPMHEMDASSVAPPAAAAPVAAPSEKAVMPVGYTPSQAPVQMTMAAAPTKKFECVPQDEPGRFFKEQERKVEQMKVSAMGYGAPPKSFYPEPQRRLMAMRAAKMDAYRSLAERVTGLRVWGGTTVGNMVIEKDRYRVFLDAFVKGAEVIAENSLEDGTYETVVELVVDQTFLSEALGKEPKPRQANNPCPEGHAPQPMASTQQWTMPMTAPAAPVAAPAAVATPAPIATPAPEPATAMAMQTPPSPAEPVKDPSSSFYYKEDQMF